LVVGAWVVGFPIGFFNAKSALQEPEIARAIALQRMEVRKQGGDFGFHLTLKDINFFHPLPKEQSKAYVEDFELIVNNVQSINRQFIQHQSATAADLQISKGTQDWIHHPLRKWNVWDSFFDTPPTQWDLFMNVVRAVFTSWEVGKYAAIHRYAEAYAAEYLQDLAVQDPQLISFWDKGHRVFVEGITRSQLAQQNVQQHPAIGTYQRSLNSALNVPGFRATVQDLVVHAKVVNGQLQPVLLPAETSSPKPTMIVGTQASVPTVSGAELHMLLKASERSAPAKEDTVAFSFSWMKPNTVGFIANPKLRQAAQEE